MFSLLFVAGVLIGSLVYIRVDSCFHLPGFSQEVRKVGSSPFVERLQNCWKKELPFLITCPVGGSLACLTMKKGEPMTSSPLAP
jgi:hypothetical protein